MRTAIGILLTAMMATQLAAQAGPVVSPREVTIRVGETATLTGYQHPGGLSAGFPYHFEFWSDTPSVAAVHGFASGQSTTHPDPIPDNGVIYVSGVAPGVAHVRLDGYAPDLSTITVLPRLLPVEIRADATRALNGQQVSLTAVVPGYGQTAMFSWYLGRIGDFAHPIRASTDPHLVFTVTGAGTVHVWVQALAGSVASSDEITIDIIQPRRRAAR
ncbi:MAG TPA: hypothetical protein VGQ46_06385 [Thermoanaerobaculia bacterium]|nr:hypothetical protein [Thermoanaerobaculia bacterium]